jgi:hypothetical protein
MRLHKTCFRVHHIDVLMHQLLFANFNHKNDHQVMLFMIQIITKYTLDKINIFLVLHSSFRQRVDENLYK